MDRTDVAILGGGLAGLALALQLGKERPDLDILVVDRRIRPQPERVSSVGESFAEIGAYYLRDVVGLRDHLDSQQLPKFGLRFFVGDAPDLADRFELGILDPSITAPRGEGPPGLPLPTHQVDRARLENEMARRCRERGIRFVEGRTVTRVELDRRGHRVELGPGSVSRLTARWIVFAGGGGMPGPPADRRSLGHRVQAAWMRVDGELDVGTWSDQKEFLSRTPPGFRRLSTNHLMGEGYWIWLIPLPGGVTSVGAVVDPTLVEFPVHDRESFLDWLAGHDTRVHAELVDTPPVDPSDFHRAELRSSLARRVFGEERWAIVGAEAAQIDVLYSPGADLVAMGNTLTTRLILDDVDKRPRSMEPRVAERLFRGFTSSALELYRNQYRNFGRPGVIGTKVLWDSALYFGFNTLLFRHGMFSDPGFLADIRQEFLAVRSLQTRVQARLSEGRIQPLVDPSARTVEWGSVSWMMDNYYGARDRSDRSSLLRRLRENLRRVERAAHVMQA